MLNTIYIYTVQYTRYNIQDTTYMHTKNTLATYARIALDGKAGIALPYPTPPFPPLNSTALLYITLHSNTNSERRMDT